MLILPWAEYRRYRRRRRADERLACRRTPDFREAEAEPGVFRIDGAESAGTAGSSRGLRPDELCNGGDGCERLRAGSDDGRDCGRSGVATDEPGQLGGAGERSASTDGGWRILSDGAGDSGVEDLWNAGASRRNGRAHRAREIVAAFKPAANRGRSEFSIARIAVGGSGPGGHAAVGRCDPCSAACGRRVVANP